MHFVHLRAFLCVGGHSICTSLSSTQCKTISLRNGLNNIYFFHNFIFVHLSAFVMHFIITKTCKTVSLRKGLKKNHFLKNVLLCIWVQSLCTILSPTQCKTVLLEGLKNNRFYRKCIFVHLSAYIMHITVDNTMQDNIAEKKIKK